MQLAQAERFLGKLIGFTGAFTTIFIVSGSVTDPVNVPKLAAIGVLGSASIAIVLFTKLRSFAVRNKSAIILLLAFLIFMISSSLFSSAPATQLLYGSYGRNNGLVTYIFLSVILLSAAALNSKRSFQSIVNSLFIAGIVNLFYCAWVLLFGDFIGWNNPYGNILGTLGNPNFIGAFFGMLFGVLFALLVGTRTSRKNKIYIYTDIPIS